MLSSHVTTHILLAVISLLNGIHSASIRFLEDLIGIIQDNPPQDDHTSVPDITSPKEEGVPTPSASRATSPSNTKECQHCHKIALPDADVCLHHLNAAQRDERRLPRSFPSDFQPYA